MKKETPTSWSDIHSRKRRRYHRILFIFLLFSFCGILIGVAWLVIYSPLLTIKSIEVTGNRNVSSENIITLADSGIFNGSWWKKILGIQNMLVWPESFSGDTLKLMPELNSINIEKSYLSRKIKIAVQEKQSLGIWCIQKMQMDEDLNRYESAPGPHEPMCWWFDSSGTLFKRAIDMEGSIFIVVDDYSQKNLGVGSKILPDKFIENTFSIFRAIAASGLGVKEMRLNDLALEEMEVDTYGGLPVQVPPNASSSPGALAKTDLPSVVLTKEGPKIYFSLRFPADNIPDVILSLKEKSVFDKLQYIDFRVENRVYYK